MEHKQELTRLEANRKILDILKSQVESYPDYRFGQLLYNVGIATHLIQNLEEIDIPVSDSFPRGKKLEYQYRDIFFEESTDTLKKLSNGSGT